MAKRNPPDGTRTGGLGLVTSLEEQGVGTIDVLGDDSPLDTTSEEETGTLEPFQDPGPHYAASSAFAATPEEHKEAGRSKKGGRPPNPVPTGEGQLIHVPTPKFQSYKSDATNPNQRTKALWSWWNALHPSQKDQLQAYVYRDWPVLKLPPGVEAKDVGANPSIDKVSGSEPIQDDIDFLHRWGVGIYRLRLNKVSRSGDSGTITTAYIGGLGNEMRSSPPADKRISDLEQLDMDHPENKSYIAFLRMHGKLADENKEENMAQAALTEVLVKDLLDNKNRANDNGGDGKSLDLIADAARRSMEMTQKSAEDYAARTRALDEEITNRRRQEVGQGTGIMVQGQDPFDQAIKIVSLLNQSKSNDQILERFMEMSNKQMEEMRAMMKESLNRPQLQPTPIVDRIKDLKDLREISRDLFGDKEDSVSDGVADAAGELAPKWLRPFIPLITPIAVGLAQGFASRPGPQPQAPPPVQYPPQALPYPPQPVQFPGQPSIPNPAPSVPPTQPGGIAVGMTQTPPGMNPEVAALLGMIRVPFLTQIQDPALTGTDFAGWFVDGFGMPTHNQVISFGPEALFQSICQFPPIANDLAQMRMPEKRVREFVAEFCDPKWQEEDGKVETPTPTPVSNGPAPVA